MPVVLDIENGTEADLALLVTGLDWTILRPGALTDGAAGVGIHEWNPADR